MKQAQIRALRGECQAALNGPAGPAIQAIATLRAQEQRQKLLAGPAPSVFSIVKDIALGVVLMFAVTYGVVGCAALAFGEPFNPYRNLNEQGRQAEQQRQWQHQQEQRDALRRDQELKDYYQQNSERYSSKPSWSDPNPQFGVQGPGGRSTCQQGFDTIYCN